MRHADRHATLADRPILPWTFVAGVFVHLVIPVYLVAAALACVPGAPPSPRIADLLAIVVPFSARFVAVYAAATLIAALAAKIADPLLRRRRARREATVPALRAQASKRRVVSAVGRARVLLGAAAAQPLAAIDAACWDYDDARYQAVAADLSRIVATASEALASARPERRAAIIATATAALTSIAVALETLAEDRRRLDEGDVETLSRYVQIRYGPADSADEADR